MLFDLNAYLRCALLLLFMILVIGVPDESTAAIEIMTDEEMAALDGQFSSIRLVDHEKPNDTVRIFLDIHQELYGSIDSVKAGYYYRDSSQLQTNMLSVGLSGFEGFYDVQQYNNGANFAFVKITSDFNTMAPQNSATIQPWGNGGFSEDDPQGTLTANSNNYDWDLWIDNMTFGESPDKPVYMNGMIIRMEFDDTLTGDVANPNLQRIVIGTNDQQGNIRANYHRYTGMTTPMLLAHTSARSAGSRDPYKYTHGSMQLKRDPFIQCFGINVFNVEDRDTGFWMIMNFEGDHVGFELVTGYPENGVDFSYTNGTGSIPLWDPDWSPYSNGPLVDPYNTLPQDQSHGYGPGTGDGGVGGGN